MGMSLSEVAQKLKCNNKKVQLIYAFNGTGKTRLSREFKLSIYSNENVEGDDYPPYDFKSIYDIDNRNILYYNALTEDLFYWDNDLESDAEPKLKVHPNSFTKWIFVEQGKESEVIDAFQNYTNKNLIPSFNSDYDEITFTLNQTDSESIENIKISKGEESNFIWCVFHSMFEQIIEELNAAVDNEEFADEIKNQFENLEYVFIDDPVTSLDDNHIIQLAVDLAELIRSSKSNKLKFIITTHNTIFYNVLHNELKSKVCYMLDKNNDGTFILEEKRGDSNKCFSYHLHLKSIIEHAIANKQIERYHFILLRNLYEKTASFLGFPRWSELLPDDKQLYYNRIIQFTSHSTLASEIVSDPSIEEKQIVSFLLNHLIDNYSFWKEQIND